MRGFAFLGLIASACGAADGVYIEVRVPDTVQATSVDLYLGQHCDSIDTESCDSMTPPRLEANTPRDEIDGEVYFADSPEVFTATVVDGIASFYLVPAKGKVEAAIAVAHTPDLGNTGVALLRPIRLDETQRVIVDLDPIVAHQMLGQDRSLEIWESPDRSHRCVGVEFDGRRVFVVPPDDADCDQVRVTGGECDPTTHLAIEPASSALPDQSCAVFDPNQVCLLGDRACDETSDIRGSCQPGTIKYCAPSALCACEDLDNSCFGTLIDLDPTLAPDATRIECEIEYEQDAASSLFRTCPGKELGETTIGEGPCAEPQITVLARDRLDGLGPTLTITDPAGDIEITPFALAPPTCRISLRSPNTVFMNGEPSSEVHHALLLIDADPGAPNPRKVLMPLDIKLVPGDCATGSRTRCQFKVNPMNENVSKCLTL